MVEFLIIATILRHPREPLYGDYSKIFLPCEINNLLYWRKMFSLFILKTKTFHICLICCCHSQDNHLSTFKKTRALQNSQKKTYFWLLLSGAVSLIRLWGVSIRPRADGRLLVTRYCRQRHLSVCLERFFHCVDAIRVRLKHACGTATEQTAGGWLGAGPQNEEVWAPWEGDREKRRPAEN